MVFDKVEGLFEPFTSLSSGHVQPVHVRFRVVHLVHGQELASLVSSLASQLIITIIIIIIIYIFIFLIIEHILLMLTIKILFTINSL